MDLETCPSGTIETNAREWLEYGEKIVRAARKITGTEKEKEKIKKRKWDDACDKIGCTCKEMELGEALGYKGKKETVCTNCCEKCPRCHQPSTNIGCSTGWKHLVCYGCAIGDHVKADSASDSSSDEENS